MVLETILGDALGGVANIVIIGGVGLTVIGGAVYTVDEKWVAIIQRLGKYHKKSHSGLGFKIPIIDQIVARVNLRAQMIELTVSTKTKDDVIVGLDVKLQYQIDPMKVEDAYYKLQDPVTQIKAFVTKIALAKVADIDMNNLYLKKEELAVAVNDDLAKQMADYGYIILETLINEIHLPEPVQKAMNTIKEQKSKRIANEEEGEAKKILVVKAAEADAEKKRQSGKGFAQQREEIAKGLEKSSEILKRALPGLTDAEISEMLFTSQYLDVLVELTKSPNTKLVAFPLDPKASTDIRSQFRQALLTAQEMPNDKESMERVADAAKKIQAEKEAASQQ